MRIALTGGTGFLGRYLIHRLTRSGHEIIAWHRAEIPENLPHDRITWIRGELGQPENARRLVEHADAVVHSGHYRDGKSFMQPPNDPLRYWHINTDGAMQLLQAAAETNPQRFIFISSGAVHDHVVPGRPLDEDHPLRPGTLYGACKAAVETLIHHFGVSGKLRTAAARPTSIYGEADPIEQSKWFPLIQAVCRGENVQATGGSKTVHADDVAAAVERLLTDAPTKSDIDWSGQTFNCCDRFISEHEVATIAKRLTNSPSRLLGPPKQIKNQIDTTRLSRLGVQFGGTALLEATIQSVVDAIRDQDDKATIR
jgi:dTDP-glucose 4,6-dehydratase